MDYNMERENNIIKNIAKEVVFECAQNGLEVSQELANYVVKLILLNPKHGFTASEVMPRNLTQQLVLMVIEELKQDSPTMNCIRMQVYWESVKLNVAALKKEYQVILMEKVDQYLAEILTLEKEDLSKMTKLVASFIIVYQNLGNPNVLSNVRETIAAFHSIFKSREIASFFSGTDEQKIDTLKVLSKRTAGIRLYLKQSGKAGEGLEDTKKVANKVEESKVDVAEMNQKISTRIEDIRETITNVVSMDFFLLDPFQMADVYLPPECETKDLEHTKKILNIMLQHSIYLSDIQSVLEEIDGNIFFNLSEFNQVMSKVNIILKSRETVPTSEIYQEFDKLGEFWAELHSYYYCLECVDGIMEDFGNINKKEYFAPTVLEKHVLGPLRAIPGLRKKSEESDKSLVLSSTVALGEEEETSIEFNGFCAWTLYFTNGLLIPGVPQAPVFKHRNLYYSFSSKNAQELWSKEPEFYIIQIYEYVRNNPELVELLKLYDALYNIRTVQLIKKVERKVSTRAEEAQTIVHPIEKYWDKDYTFSIWELRKRALTLSRLVKCVTKSVQTVSPHSHFRASIGLLAAPDKDKEVQTKKDSSCVHPTIARYLYGLRGHKEDMFRAVELTRPVEETCERQIELGEKPTCKERREAAMALRPPQLVQTEPCPPLSPKGQCDLYEEFGNQTETSDNEGPLDNYYFQYNPEG